MSEPDNVDLIDVGEDELARAPQQPITRVVFVGTPLSETFDRAPDHASRESLGVWLDRGRGRAWKIYASNTTFARVRAQYNTAQAEGLPIGQPNVAVQEGRVTVTRRNTAPRTTNGFVLVTPIFTGTFFQGATRFRTALQREGITTRSNVNFNPIHAACTTARRIGLRDIQGYISAGAVNPILFADIHVQAGSVQPGQDLLDILNALPA